jgi:hypothetical protein
MGYFDDGASGASYDWGKNKDAFDWGNRFDVDTVKSKGSGKTNWAGIGRFAGDALSSFGKSSGNRDPYGFSYGRFTPGEFGGGGGGKVLDNLGVIYPQQVGPTFIPGTFGEEGKSTGSRIAGGLGGALRGAATGAAFGPIGIAAGALIGGASGAFG